MRVWMKRVGYVVGALVALVLVAVSVVYGMSETRFRRTYTVASEQHAFSTDSAVLARGEHLVSSIGCLDCHGQGMRGQAFIDAAPMGRLIAPNLTRGKGGLGDSLDAAAFERALRHGISHSGRSLLVMPSEDYQYLSDSDFQAIASYLHALPPIDNELGRNNIMVLPRALLVAGQLPFLSAENLTNGKAAKPMNVTPAVSREYGGYLANIGGCTGCHGPGLSGGKIPGTDPSWPPAANLTPAGALGKWNEAQFIAAIRTGARPDGSTISTRMPWQQLRNLSDDELKAIWLYLQTVPSREFGNR